MKRKIFILAGQSNMAGRGELCDVPTFSRQSQIQVYSYTGRWGRACDPVGHTEGKTETIFADRKAGAGPAMAFANRLATYIGDIEIGLVPAAKGATYMDEWAPQTSHAPYYGAMIERVFEASKHGEISGMIWYQGENDCLDFKLTAGWPEKFKALVRAVRRDLNIRNLPVIMTTLGPNRAPERYRYWNEFVVQQNEMALPRNVVAVTANDLTGIKGDPHLTTADYLLLGERYGDAMAKLIMPAKI